MMVHHYLEDKPEVVSKITPHPDERPPTPEAKCWPPTPEATPSPKCCEPPPIVRQNAYCEPPRIFRQPPLDIPWKLPPLPEPPDPPIRDLGMCMFFAFAIGATTASLLAWSFSKKGAVCSQ